MSDFFEIKSIGREDQKRILEEFRRKIAEKKKEGLLSEREVREIEEMNLYPLPDIPDVQSVYEDHMFKKKKRMSKK